ncbi:hypothetical protein cypCar_00035863 [Cyprinus carpio]|nr:hypothetical protein cypCar_00035863 [Cyprinus carpio]
MVILKDEESHEGNLRQTEFSCPAFDERGICGARLSFEGVCGLIPLTNKQTQFFQENLSLVTAGHLCNYKAIREDPLVPCTPEFKEKKLRKKRDDGMSAAMRDFSQREEHSRSDSCFVVLMSHGSASGICGVSSIVNSDGEEDIFSTDDIYNCLNTTNCPGLRDKPKIILIQSCRGDTISIRNPQRGSDFIQDIVEIFNKHAHEDHIEELFRKAMSL